LARWSRERHGQRVEGQRCGPGFPRVRRASPETGGTASAAAAGAFERSRGTPMTAKLGKLIRMLSSDQPGEVTSAARAIVRTLQAAGTDIHALADHAERLQEPPRENNNKRRSWRDRRAWCAEHSGHLTARELEFITSLARWRGYPTPKQMDWLEAIEEKIRSRSGAR
jgi:hypothetical protein